MGIWGSESLFWAIAEARRMSAITLLVYCFAFGMLHGILPDEHTWPITFSYAIGGASGSAGIKAGLYFSAAFTFQRMILAELSYLALAPFLLSPGINGFVYVAVGLVMFVAGVIVLRRNRYPHVHLLDRCRDRECEIQETTRATSTKNARPNTPTPAPPVQWTLVHGFIAGFGLGGFSMFVNVVAAPAMPSPWVAFLPGFVFGLGTMLMLVILGGLIGISLRHLRSLSGEEIRRIGSQTGGRTLLFGGLLFGIFGLATIFGWSRHLPLDVGYLLIALFMIGVAVPSCLWSLKEVLQARRRSPDRPSGAAQAIDLSGEGTHGPLSHHCRISTASASAYKSARAHRSN
jgi:hypothetical protein